MLSRCHRPSDYNKYKYSATAYRSVTQSLHPEDSHLLADGGVAQTSSNSSGGSDIHSWTWKQKFGDVRLRHAAMLVHLLQRMRVVPSLRLA